MRFEYKVVSLRASIWSGAAEKRDAKFQEQLNNLGMVGWDLIAVQPHGTNMQAFLKREK